VNKDLFQSQLYISTTEDNFPLSSIVVGIPAFNEAKNIRDVIKKAKLYCDKIVVCDDGSVDDTAEVARSEGATVIKHLKKTKDMVLQ